MSLGTSPPCLSSRTLAAAMRPLAFVLWKPMLWMTASSSSSSAAAREAASGHPGP